MARGSLVSTTRLGLATAAVTSSVLLLLGPLIIANLYLGWDVIVLTAALVFPVVMCGGWLGVLQGQHLFGRLAIGMILLGLARFAGIITGILLGQSVTGILLTKGAMWAPQVVTVLAVPHLAARRRHALPRATAAIAVVGAILVAAATLFSELALQFAGGAQYVLLLSSPSIRTIVTCAATSAMACLLISAGTLLWRHKLTKASSCEPALQPPV